MRRLCPDCRAERWRSWLTLIAGPWRTDRLGTLRYWRCPRCRTQFVSQNTGTPEEVA